MKLLKISFNFFFTAIITVFFVAKVSMASNDNFPVKKDPGTSSANHSQIVYKSQKHDFHLYPAGDSYPHYIADPRNPVNGVMNIHLSQTDIPAGGNKRFHLSTGGRFGVLRVTPHDSTCYGLELSIECGLLAQFNIDSQLDNIGWDGFYGLLLAWQCGPDLSLKFASQHDSSHVGDEYIETTNTKRIGYTREEFAFGVSFQATDILRIYSEIGRAYKYKQFMEPYRLQTGIELTGPLYLIQKSSGWYAAADIVSWEENDWDLSMTLHLGLRTKTGENGRQYRLGIQYYDGRSHIGEFFRYRERYTSFGIFVDI